MLYGYLSPFNHICNMFGLIKPIITAEGKPIKINFWLKLWSLLAALGLITNFMLPTSGHVHIKFKENLEMVSDINDLFVNVLIILLNLIRSETNCISLHEIFDVVFRDLNIDPKILKVFAYKMYFWLSTTMIIFLSLIIMELVQKYPPYILLMRIPTFLTYVHLTLHIYIILAIVKVINQQLTRTLTSDNKMLSIISNENMGTTNIIKYVLDPSIKFIEVSYLPQFDLKLLSKIYDNLSTCIHLLEKCYGLQIFLSIWSMFTSAAVGVTVLVCQQITLKWLVIVKSMLPLAWCYIACFINEQLSKEVEKTITLIIKCLIDYRCVPSKKPVLETFKELVSNDRLDFTACSLFDLSYAMLLGTLLNIITYTIILIQLL